MNQSAATPLSEHVRTALTNAAKRQGETTRFVDGSGNPLERKLFPVTTALTAIAGM